ncbi:hypothetical protein [Nocardia wallacei]|uniref:hypothetical protein n=1 Tax=Nocardia wallacei TaxID=480035 RepID=UPI00245893C2|nr:hypothetical protein [Nocardia wallacei]
MTVFELNDDEIFVALLSQDGDELGYDDFDDFDTAREWADKHIRDAVTNSGAVWDFRVHVLRVDYDEFESESWGVDADAIVARASWDRAAGSVTWQTVGPFDL